MRNRWFNDDEDDDRGRGEFERRYGSYSGAEGYGGRDYAHTGSFSGTDGDFSEPPARPRGGRDDFGSGDRGYVSRERSRMSLGSADNWGQRRLATGGRDSGTLPDARGYGAPFDDEPRTFGMNMPGNFGFDRGGEGARAYFGGSDRGRATTSSYASGHGQSGGDLDRGFAGNSAAGGIDRGYSGGLNYGFGGNAHRSFRGMGPRNYRRNDERLRELACERLADDHDVDASDIEVAVENGVVRLTGTVPHRRMKRIAEDVIEQIGGVGDVDNQLRVGAQTDQQRQ